jgi:hypothetical protein
MKTKNAISVAPRFPSVACVSSMLGLEALTATVLHECRFRISLLRRGWESLRGGRRIATPFNALSRLRLLAEQPACAP